MGRISSAQGEVQERYEMGLKLEACGLCGAEISRRLGYANKDSWRQLKVSMIKQMKRDLPVETMHSAAAHQISRVNPARPMQMFLQVQTTSEKIATMLGITAEELDTIVDMIIDCRRK